MTVRELTGDSESSSTSDGQQADLIIEEAEVARTADRLAGDAVSVQPWMLDLASSMLKNRFVQWGVMTEAMRNPEVCGALGIDWLCFWRWSVKQTTKTHWLVRNKQQGAGLFEY